MKRALPGALMLCFALACDSGTDPTDAGPEQDASMDGAVPPCERASDCDDGLFCNGVEQCAPGAGADARGCVTGDVPCALDQVCEESTDACEADDCQDPDEDGDGRDRISCGGDDCDDEDANRFPGNVEACDASHDEDCDPSTLGGTDADGDGAVSAMCCNGGACGPDCDDSNPGVGPLVGEVCNGVDDDCDGTIDTAAEPLCPGGECMGSSCRLDAWERAFGSTDFDLARGVALDSRGGVVVATQLKGTVDVGGPTPEAYDSLAIISYDATGAFRWSRSVPEACEGVPGTGGGTGTTRPLIEVDGSGNVVVAACCEGSQLPGEPAREERTVVVSLDPSGQLRWSYPAFRGCATAAGMSQDGGHVIVGGFTYFEVDLGEGTHTPSDADGFLLEIDADDGALVDTAWLDGPGREVVRGVAEVGGGTVVAVEVGEDSSPATQSCVDVNTETLCEPGPHYQLALLEPSGEVRWNFPTGGLLRALDARGEVFAATFIFGGEASFGGAALTSIGAQQDSALVAYGPDGTVIWQRHLASPGAALAEAVSVGRDGSVAVTGLFYDTITLGGSPSGDGSPDADVFVAWYGADGSSNGHAVYGGDGFDLGYGVALGEFRDLAIAGHFQGTVELGTSTYTSAGESDAFVIRRSY